MKVDFDRHGTVTVIAPHDALSEGTLGDLQEAIRQVGEGGGRARIVLDLTQVAFVDSAGIEYLLDLGGAEDQCGVQPRLAAMNDTVRDALNLTEVLPRLAVYDSVEAAVRSYL